MTLALRQHATLRGRTLVVDVAEHGDDVTLWFVDAPDDPLVMPSVTAQVVGMALQRASAVVGRRGASARDRRLMACVRRDRAKRLARAVEIEVLRRGDTTR